MTHKLEPLPYAYDALEPYIDEATMRIHHDKHHQAYVDKLNAAVHGTELENKNAEELLIDLNAIPEKIRTAVRNHGGGTVNHNFFWHVMKKDVPLRGEIAKAIEKTFDNTDKFKEQFSAAATNHFGSGWAWLVLNNDVLEIVTTSNQDSPLSIGKTPLLTIDVWEHSYYLKYQNKRADYVQAFWNVIDWYKVNDNFLKAKK